MMRRGFANVKKTAQRTSSSNAPSFPALPSYRPSSKDSNPNPPFNLQPPTPRNRRASQGPTSGPLAAFTVQDIQTTHRLLTEQWDRQCYRLAKYLERNWCLLQDIPCNMEIEDEKFERPGSVGSIGKLLEQVKLDTTPKVERDAYFGDEADERSLPPIAASLPIIEMHKDSAMLSFKQFVLQTGPHDVESSEEETESGAEEVWMERKIDAFAEPKTPTQMAFTSHIGGRD